MKGGTTSLHHYLEAHPDIAMPRVKETNFFLKLRPTRNHGPSTYDRGFDWYRSLYAEGAQVYGDVSPNYSKRHLFGDDSARLLHEANPDVKLIYLMRDPVQRFLSHYAHSRAEGRGRPPLSEIIQRHKSNYSLTSCYHYQLEPYLRYFSADQFIFLSTEELREDTNAALQRIFAFIGVRPFTSEVFANAYHIGSEKQDMSVLEEQVKHPRLRKVLKPLLPKRFAAARPLERPRLSDAEHALLAERFAPDVERLRALTGLAFDKWSV